MRYLVMLTPLLVSCAVITYDVTKDPLAARIAGQCFALQRDAYVVKTGGIGTENKLMAPGEGVCSPDGTLESHGHRCNLTVKALIPRGSTLTVLQVKNHAMGESGRCWAVTARLIPPSPFGDKVMVPTCLDDWYGQDWLNAPNPERTKEPLEFKPHYLLPCVSSAP